MKIHEKIRKLREELGLTIQEVRDRCITIFGSKKTMSYRTLQRIERGQISKFSSILKICCALGIPLQELLKDTELEQRLVIRKKERLDEYTYNEKAFASVISSPSRSFLALELMLEPGGKTLAGTKSCQRNFRKVALRRGRAIDMRLGRGKIHFDQQRYDFV
jgi:transcriptional regulator with XRE-family HTH domain